MPNRPKRKSANNSGSKADERKGGSDPKTAVNRKPCLCQASVHPLINNCTNCGRIVCEVEGSGFCMTCGELVCTNEEQELLARDTKASQELREKLNYVKTFQDIGKVIFGGSAKPSEFEKAISYKNRLLNYDQTVERRTIVIDDAADYASQGLDAWLPAEKREEILMKEEAAHELRHTRQQPAMLTLDFAGRQIIEEQPQELPLDIDEILADDISIFDCPTTKDLIHDNKYQPKYVEVPHKHYSNPAHSKRDRLRIQNEELQLMSDEGMCLTIQQPYASFIMAGIKRHEGRNWYTSFRGRLWIHAGAKEPTKRTICQAENAYRHLTGTAKFPTMYPCGCLVGCIDLIDCRPQEQYRAEFPNGEIADSYIFYLEGPKELKIKLPMSGKRGIFKMDERFHQAAKKTLMKL